MSSAPMALSGKAGKLSRKNRDAEGKGFHEQKAILYRSPFPYTPITDPKTVLRADSTGQIATSKNPDSV